MADDLDDYPPFVPSEWIGVNKKFPEDPTPTIYYARNAILEIPASEIVAPAPGLPVRGFVDMSLPPQSSSLIFSESKLWFSTEAPTTNVSVLRTRPVPPKEILEALSRKFSQAWFDGTKSICDPRFNDGTDRFPLWTLMWWKDMAKLVEKQAKWKRSIKWLESERDKSKDVETTGAVNGALEMLRTLGWNKPLNYLRGNVTTMDLAELLATVWLRTDHIDIMMEEIAAQVESDPKLSDKVVVASLSFEYDIKATGKGKSYPKKSSGLLRSYEEEIKEKNKEWLIFPANFGNKHWVAGIIDFKKKIFGFGDSLPNYFDPPKKLLNGIKLWLRHRFSKDFQYVPDALKHAEQNDGFSCAFLTKNTIEHKIFQTGLWIPRRAVFDRVSCFIRYAKNLKTPREPEEAQITQSTVTEDPSTTYLELPVRRAGVSLRDILNHVQDEENDGEPSSSDDESAADDDVLLGRMANDENDVGDSAELQSDVMSMTTSSGVDDWHREDTDADGDVSELQSDAASMATSGGVDDWNAEEEPDGDVSSDAASMAASSGVDDWKAEVEPDDVSGQQSYAMSMTPSTGADGDVDMPLVSREEEPVVPAVQSSSLPKKKRGDLFSFLKPGAISGTSFKRHRGDSDSEGDRGEGTSKKKGKKPKRDPEAEPAKMGTSRSAVAARVALAALKAGAVEINPEKLEAWKKEIREIDPDASFPDDDIRRVRHSKCGSSFLVKSLYNVSRFNSHVKDCKGKLAANVKDKSGKVKGTTKGAGTMSMKTLLTSGWASKSKKTATDTVTPKPPKAHVTKPCPGITEYDLEHVPQYLRRSGALGGGSRSVYRIAQDLFHVAFSALNKRKKDEVLDVQQHEQKWRNDHANLRVFSTDCRKTAELEAKSQPLPCSSCSKLLSNRAFRTAVNKEPPADGSYIYVNERFRNQALGEMYARTIGLKDIIEAPDAKTTPCIRYAQGALQGKYDDKVFSGLVEAMVTKLDREERGVGMQNFTYAPAYDEFCNVMRISSPEAYRTFQKHLPARSAESFRAKESREPRFPMDICERSFELAAEHLKALKYDGPVNLSCDDTKLFPSMRLYWDGSKDSHFLVGGADGPIRVADPEQVKKVIEETRQKQATKIRLWCITVPVDGVTPIIVAALPILGDMKSDQLLIWLKKVVNGLLDHKIKSERNVQDDFVKQAEEKIEHLIKDPSGKGPDIRIRIAVIRGQPICMIQDSKHALKTFRNNLFSGARLVTLGSYTAIYAHIRQMAFEDGSPLFHRDVEKLDRQDDNAATRLFSADTLKYLADHHPEYLGEIIYLFVFGELIDAYQNRDISHAERVKMVLRARYFMDAWESFLTLSGYAKSTYFLSREAVDITRIIIEGYLSLIYIHRDHIDGIFPLFPWLHSTEACEHIFGESRKIVKDFTMLDFLYMVPKLRVKLRATILRGKSSNSKARAAGYSHTYFDNSGINVLALSTFPSDDEISLIAAEAMEESDSLLAMLGLSPAQLHSADAREFPVLPSINTWFDESLHDTDEDSDTNSISEAQELQGLIDEAENGTFLRPRAQEEQLLSLTCAALALSANDMIKLNGVSDPSPEIEDEIAAEEFGRIQETLSITKQLNISEPSKPLGRGEVTAQDLDFDLLVDLRRRHQTKQAASGVRTRFTQGHEKAEELSTRRQLIRRFHLVLKEEQSKATGTGLERAARWHAAAPGGRNNSGPPLAGNTANAAVAASALAKKAASKRKTVFTKANVPILPDIVSARVTVHRPIRVGDYGVVMTTHGLRIGKVIELYSKGGGKNGKHEPVTESNIITAISYASVQVFEHQHGAQFRSIPLATAVLQTKQFAHIPSINFLCLISAPKPVTIGLELTQDDAQRFKALMSGTSRVEEAMKLFRKRGNAAKDGNEDGDGEE
ncbi:hypothetical protein C8J57DRAFT_1456964 [Mycena rebaudengoi]|nr:hypothetical protein C8J57DRAFT_1456964 [Mycena rebaudengoi]